MNLAAREQRSPAPALLIAPDRDLAARLQEALDRTRLFQVLTDLASYPAPSVLEMRIRQLRPAAVLVDLATDADAACEVIRTAALIEPPSIVIGVDHAARPEVVMRALQLGACEFLTAPFDAEMQKRAVEAVRRLAGAGEPARPEQGKIIAFANAKPGSGASALASQAAFALARQVRGRVLLADLDFAGGAVSFYTGAESQYSFLDLLGQSCEPEPLAVAALAVRKSGVDVLPAPPVPRPLPDEPARLREAFDRMRRACEWAVLDLPCIFERISLLALTETDCTYLVATPDLAGLHLARRAVRLLQAAGVGADRYEPVLNRTGKRDGMTVAEIGRILGRPVQILLPEDHGGLHAAAAQAQALERESPLGRALEQIVSRLSGVTPPDPGHGGALLEAGPVFAGA